jgi:hypothetical protein
MYSVILITEKGYIYIQRFGVQIKKKKGEIKNLAYKKKEREIEIEEKKEN